MAQPTLAERVTALEQQLAELKTALENGVRVKDWRRTVGMFSYDDEVMRRIDEAALQYREADREKARRRYAKSRRAKP